MLLIKKHNTYKKKYLKKDIKKYIEEKNLIKYNNKLEAVLVLATGKEIENGEFDKFIDKMALSFEKSNLENIKITKNLDFIIISKCKNKIKIDKIKNFFNKIKIIEIKIPKEYDFYLKNFKKIKDIKFKDQIDLKYGCKSGPNYSFFRSLEHLKNYNTTLFLECDVFFGINWIKKIYDNVIYSNGFWISGATYDGCQFTSKQYNSIVHNHINGGVCLYATANENFKNFIDFCEGMLKTYILKINKDIPYDYLIYNVIEDYISYDVKNIKIWKFIKRNYLKNNTIFNLSTEEDIEESIDDIQKKYDFALLHKK